MAGRSQLASFVANVQGSALLLHAYMLSYCYYYYYYEIAHPLTDDRDNNNSCHYITSFKE
jgi:hypothetical protein